MAEKRMYTKKITDSDAFIELSSAAQALYFHLNQGADDDGFNNQIQLAMLKAHASIDDLKVLLMKNFIIRFESGVIVIKHWRMHNTLRKDRYTPTNFQEELASLQLKDNGAYTLGCQTVAKWLPKNREEEVSIDKDSLEEVSSAEKSADTPKRFKKPTLEEVAAYCRERKNNVNPQRFIDFYTSKGWKVGKEPMKDWKACIRTWEQDEKGKPKKGADPSKYDREDE